MTKPQRADAIWRSLFLENSPISEATRGVVNVLHAFGLPTQSSDLTETRAFFRQQDIARHVEKVFQIAGVSRMVMTNDPLDPEEAPLWAIARLILSSSQACAWIEFFSWTDHWQIFAHQGYAVESALSGTSIGEIRQFTADWCTRMHPVYMAVSLPHSFRFPDDSLTSKLIAQAVLPSCREFRLPSSLMIGIRYQVNPQLRLA